MAFLPGCPLHDMDRAPEYIIAQRYEAEHRRQVMKVALQRTPASEKEMTIYVFSTIATPFLPPLHRASRRRRDT